MSYCSINSNCYSGRCVYSPERRNKVCGKASKTSLVTRGSGGEGPVQVGPFAIGGFLFFVCVAAIVRKITVKLGLAKDTPTVVETTEVVNGELV